MSPNSSDNTRDVVVTHALRTPIGKYLGSCQELSAADLGTSVVSDLLGRSGVDAGRVGELIFGNGRQAGGGPNVARQISVRAGLPDTTPAYTVNMACGSGLLAIIEIDRVCGILRFEFGAVGGKVIDRGRLIIRVVDVDEFGIDDVRLAGLVVIVSGVVIDDDDRVDDVLVGHTVNVDGDRFDGIGFDGSGLVNGRIGVDITIDRRVEVEAG